MLGKLPTLYLTLSLFLREVLPFFYFYILSLTGGEVKFRQQ